MVQKAHSSFEAKAPLVSGRKKHHPRLVPVPLNLRNYIKLKLNIYNWSVPSNHTPPFKASLPSSQLLPFFLLSLNSFLVFTLSLLPCQTSLLCQDFSSFFSCGGPCYCFATWFCKGWKNLLLESSRNLKFRKMLLLRDEILWPTDSSLFFQSVLITQPWRCRATIFHWHWNSNSSFQHWSSHIPEDTLKNTLQLSQHLKTCLW